MTEAQIIITTETSELLNGPALGSCDCFTSQVEEVDQSNGFVDEKSYLEASIKQIKRHLEPSSEDQSLDCFRPRHTSAKFVSHHLHRHLANLKRLKSSLQTCKLKLMLNAHKRDIYPNIYLLATNHLVKAQVSYLFNITTPTTKQRVSSVLDAIEANLLTCGIINQTKIIEQDEIDGHESSSVEEPCSTPVPVHTS